MSNKRYVPLRLSESELVEALSEEPQANKERKMSKTYIPPEDCGHWVKLDGTSDLYASTDWRGDDRKNTRMLWQSWWGCCPVPGCGEPAREEGG